jgi:chromate transporter
MGAAAFSGPVAEGFLHGLKLVAVAVVAQAIWGMARALAPDRGRAGIALAAVAIVVAFAGSFGQVSAIALGACLGLWLCRGEVAPVSGQLNFPVTRRGGGMALVLFAVLLLIGPAVAAVTGSQGLTLFDAFYRSGALVFGGGHVVLPLLERAVVAPGCVDQADFLSGYGAAQAVPGPLFTFAAYLGAVIRPTPSPVAFAALALAAIFLPGLLLIAAVLPFWNGLRRRRWMQNCLAGVNASVVGILLAAFLRPVWSSAVHSPFDLVVALAALALLVRYKLPPWVVVVSVAALSALAQRL